MSDSDKKGISDVKLYEDCPNSYRLLCSIGDSKAISQAVDQLRVDHPEAFILDDLYESSCLIMVKSSCTYALKNPGSGVTLLEDQEKGWKQDSPECVYPDVVLRIHLDHVHVFLAEGLVEVTGDKRRSMIERMKLNPDWLEYVRAIQAKILAEKEQQKDWQVNQEAGPFEEIIWAGSNSVVSFEEETAWDTECCAQEVIQ
jgi:hypothetical protein